MFPAASYALTINEFSGPGTELHWNKETYLYADDPSGRR